MFFLVGFEIGGFIVMSCLWWGNVMTVCEVIYCVQEDFILIQCTFW